MARMGVHEAITVLNGCSCGSPHRFFIVEESPVAALNVLAGMARNILPREFCRDVARGFINLSGGINYNDLDADIAEANAALDVIGEAAEEHGIRWWEIPPG